MYWQPAEGEAEGVLPMYVEWVNCECGLIVCVDRVN